MGDRSFDFVVQEHHVGGRVHWDVMLARPGGRGEGRLATWRVGFPPLGINVSRGVRVRRLGDHRGAYLTYEGPIGGGRGRCRIFDRGRYELVLGSEEVWQVVLAGERVRGRFLFRRTSPPEEWILAKWVGVR